MKYIMANMIFIVLLLLALYFNIETESRYQLDIISNGEIIKTYDCKEVSFFKDGVICATIEGESVSVNQRYMLTVR